MSLQQACAIDPTHKLKLLSRLKARDLDPNHYEKMNVASAYSLVNRSTASALRYLVGEVLPPNTALTTFFLLTKYIASVHEFRQQGQY